MRRSLIAAVGVTVLLAGCAADGDDSQSVGSAPDVTFSTVPATAAPETTVVATTDTTQTVSTGGTMPATTVLPLTAEQVSFAPFVSDLTSPVDMAWRAGDDALYVVLQGGTIVPVRGGVAGTPVLDVSDIIVSGGEQGLLGLAFHPTKPLAYVNYTDNDGDTMIVEYAVASDGTFDPASARPLLTIDQPYGNHNGGNVEFGPDGHLYIGMGDGGSGGDPERRGLNVSELLGKILRIDPTPSGDQPYTIPADNPFVGVDGARPEIWSVGVRNPWRFTFDSATGDLWIGDVGQGQWEEVDLARAVDGGGRGLNFGWSAFEGTHPFNDDQSPEGVTMPIFEYEHGSAGCSVSGGDVYHGSEVPSLVGWYLFSDYCSGIVTALQQTDGALTGHVELGTIGGVSAICTGPDGQLYVLSLNDNAVYRVAAA
jgi:glucose/arabinose dehydrogenase